MIDPHTLLIFAAACFALCITPGPDMILVAARSAAQGRGAGLVTYLGVAAGAMFHALLLALGLSKLFLAVPYAYDLVRYLGAAYLLFLAWQTITTQSDPAAPKAHRRALWVVFRQGFFSNVLNPKVALFFLALFPQFLDPTSGSVVTQVFVLACVLQVVGLLVNGTVVWLAGGARQMWLSGGSFTRWSRYFLGAVFGGLAARLIFDNQR
ncbi:LysE family translocator [uncultured Roseobacter sp.]|uniref:LysE family translocator n=1 Tax=uncultured Roseobacter sp. TaxID=114847 RepID=UPI00262CDF7F|nr:LysE family translocator [uncultured Roseobacter sp.]